MFWPFSPRLSLGFHVRCPGGAGGGCPELSPACISGLRPWVPLPHPQDPLAAPLAPPTHGTQPMLLLTPSMFGEPAPGTGLTSWVLYNKGVKTASSTFYCLAPGPESKASSARVQLRTSFDTKWPPEEVPPNFLVCCSFPQQGGRGKQGVAARGPRQSRLKWLRGRVSEQGL